MKAAQRIIEKGISNLKIDLEASTGKPLEKVGDVFCEYYPAIEIGLGIAICAIKNPVGKWLIKLVLMICGSIKEKSCAK